MPRYFFLSLMAQIQCTQIHLHIHLFSSGWAHAFGSSRVEFTGGGGGSAAEARGEEGR
jgi:hypothetical protein